MADKDPFTQVYEKLWDLLETDSQLAAHVKVANRIKLNSRKVLHGKFRLSTKDLPELTIEPAGGTCEIKRTTTSMPITQHFAVRMKTHDLRVDRSFFPIKFALLNRLTDVTGNLGLSFVRRVQVDDMTDGRNDDGHDGWHTAFNITVEMWFKIT